MRLVSKLGNHYVPYGRCAECSEIAICAIPIANFHRRSEIAVISDVLSNIIIIVIKETLRFKGANCHR